MKHFRWQIESNPPTFVCLLHKIHADLFRKGCFWLAKVGLTSHDSSDLIGRWHVVHTLRT